MNPPPSFYFYGQLDIFEFQNFVVNHSIKVSVCVSLEVVRAAACLLSSYSEAARAFVWSAVKKKKAYS